MSGHAALRAASILRATTRHLVANPTGYVIRTHTSPDIDVPPVFNHLNREDTVMLARCLQLNPACCHICVSDSDAVDLFMDIESPASTRQASEKVLKHVLDASRKLLEEAIQEDRDYIDKILVLTASDGDHKKQSLHLHIRLDRPVASRREVRYFVERLKKKLPSAVSSWVDIQPAVSGSLRIIHATKADGTRPLVPLVITQIVDDDLHDYLVDKYPEAEAEQVEMSLIKRFDAWEEPYRFMSDYHASKLAAAAAAGEMDDASEEAAMDFLYSSIENGDLAVLVQSLPAHLADDYASWASVMWAVKSIAAVADANEMYEAFDEFSRASPDKYNPRKNRRAWDTQRAGDPCIAHRYLMKMRASEA